MATKNTEETGEMPFYLVALPFLVAGTYFGYNYYYKKKDLTITSSISALLFIGAAIPWFNYKSVSGTASVLTSSADNHLNSMDSTGRKAAIDYIIGRMEKFDARAKYAPPGPPSREKRVAAYNTLSNDELKVLYCIYKFTEDKDKLVAKYGNTSSDELAKKAAKETYGIDLSNVPNVEKTASIAVTKAMTALA